MSDKKRLKQILINIIGNSIKFTNEGEIELIINEMSRTRPKYDAAYEIKSLVEKQNF